MFLFHLGTGRSSNTFHGESGFSLYYRGRQHLDGFTRQVPGNTLHDHKVQYHPHEKLTTADFRMTVMSTAKRPIIRLSREGISITHTQKQVERGERVVLMNDKSTFFQPGVVKVRTGGVL